MTDEQNGDVTGSTKPTSKSKKVRAPRSHSAGITEAQVTALLDGAFAVADRLGEPRNKDIIIQPKEAAYLQTVPGQLLEDITSLALRRVRRRTGSSYLEQGDVDWAWNRLVVGKRESATLPIINTIGSVLFGAGLPILVGPIISGQSLTAGGAGLGVGLSFVGLVMLSVALTVSVFRR